MDPSSAAATAETIAQAIERRQFHYSNEWELQRGVAIVLDELKLEFHKEVVLGPKQRIDFLVGKVGIEVKVDMSLAGVTRQLWHYADSPQIEALILVTTRHVHRGLPLEMKGKPLFVIYLLNL
jgi:hypothetical protein